MSTVLVSRQPGLVETVRAALPEGAGRLRLATEVEEIEAELASDVEALAEDGAALLIVDGTSLDPLAPLEGLDKAGIARFGLPIVALYDAARADSLTLQAMFAAGVAECVPHELLSSASLRAALLRAQARVRLDKRRQRAQRPRASEVLGSVDDQRYRLIVEHARDVAIFTLDLDGRITSWNDGARRLLGYEEAEILGRPFSTIFTPDDVESGVDKTELEEALAKGNASDFRWHRRRDGSEFWVDGQLMVMQRHDEHGEPTGEVIGFLKILQDRTEARRTFDALREERDRHRLALRAAEMGSWDYRPRTQTFSLGERAQHLLFGGVINGTILLDRLLQRFVEEDREPFTSFLTRICASTEHRHTVEVRTRDREQGERRFMLSGLCRQERHAEQAEIIGTVQDITAATRMEQMLAELNASLETDLAHEVAWSKELKRFAQRLCATTDRMHIRAARVLHEHVQQILVAARHVAATVRDRVDASLRKQLDRVEEMLKEALASSHDVVEELYPPVLYERGLADGLNWLAHEFELDAGVRTELALEGLPAKQPVRNVDTFVFGFVRTLLRHLAHCAEAPSIKIRVTQKRDELRVSLEEPLGVLDPGADDPRVIPPRVLADLRNQAEVLDGSLTLETPAHGGTRIKASLPLTSRQAH